MNLSIDDAISPSSERAITNVSEYLSNVELDERISDIEDLIAKRRAELRKQATEQFSVITETTNFSFKEYVFLSLKCLDISI